MGTTVARFQSLGNTPDTREAFTTARTCGPITGQVIRSIPIVTPSSPQALEDDILFSAAESSGSVAGWTR